MAEDFAKDTAQQRARKAFTALITQEDTIIDLTQAALLIAAEEYPELDIDQYVAQIDRLAMRVRTQLELPETALYTPLPPEISHLDAILAMNKVLFEQEHFHGNQADYYNPHNSFLNDVLEKQQGIPITLSLLYMEVGRRVGLPIDGIGLPFHFVVRCQLTKGTIYIDPFEKGRLLSEKDCRARVYRTFRDRTDFNPRWLEPVSPRQLLIRMLANLKHIYLHREDYTRALSICDRLLLLAPAPPTERRDRGIIHFHLKRYARAIRDLNAYIELSPDAEDSANIKQQIRVIRQLMAMMN